MTNFQRKGAIRNAHVGREFEKRASAVLGEHGLKLDPSHKVAVGIVWPKKEHAFDLDSENLQVIVELKAHTWTERYKVSSAKMKNWVEAMFYLYVAPDTYRKILFVERGERKTTGETLLSYFMRTHSHMIPSDVEFWELNGVTGEIFKFLQDSNKGYI